MRLTNGINAISHVKKAYTTCLKKLFTSKISSALIKKWKLQEFSMTHLKFNIESLKIVAREWKIIKILQLKVKFEWRQSISYNLIFWNV